MEDFIDIFEDVDELELVDAMERRVAQGQPRSIRTRIDHFDKWDEAEFFNRFRIHKYTANVVLEIIKDSIVSKTTRNHALTPADKFLLTLRYFASAGFQLNVGDHTGVHQTTVSRVIKKVAHSLANLASSYIKMPETAEEKDGVIQDFYMKAKFPNCIGAIDCTHVKIKSPGGDNAEVYRCRKGYFSMNVQVVSDAKNRIRDIVSRWFGSAHDAHIFNSSTICARFESGEFGSSVLLGDSGYGLRNFLITPLSNPNVNNPAEMLFQESQIRTRNPVECTFGIWKRRFPVLATGILLDLDRVESVIVATAVLHNIAQLEREDIPPLNEEQLAAINQLNENGQEHGYLQDQNPIGGNAVRRNQLINNYFQSLLDNQNQNR